MAVFFSLDKYYWQSDMCSCICMTQVTTVFQQ